MPLLNVSAGATTPSNVDPRFALVTARPIGGDESELAGLMEERGDIGLITQSIPHIGSLVQQAHQGYEKLRLRGQLEPYAEQARTDLDTIDMLTSEVSDLGEQRDKIKQGHLQAASLDTDSYNESFKKLQSIESEYVNSIEKLRRAHKQGILSSSQFDLQIRAKTREAAARNPGYTNELIGYARDIQYMAGIRDVQDPTNALLKSQNVLDETDKKELTRQLRAKNINFSVYDLEDSRKREDLRQELYTANTNARKATEITQYVQSINANKTTTRVDRRQAGVSILNGSMLNLNEAISSYGDSISGMDVNARKTTERQFRNELQSAENQLRYNLEQLDIPASEINTHISTLRAHADSSLNLVHDVVSGKATIDDLQANLKLSNMAFKEHMIAEGASPEVMKYIKTLPAAIQYNILNSKGGKEYLNNFSSAILNANNRAAKSFFSDKNIESNKLDCQVALESCIISQNKGSTAKLAQVYSEYLNVDNSKLEPKDRMRATYAITDSLANVPIDSKFNLDDATKTDLSKIVQTNTEVSSRYFRNEASALEADGYNISTEFDNGLLRYVVTKDGQPAFDIQGRLNTKYAQAFNIGVKSYARLYKSSWQTTSEGIMQRWGSLFYHNVRGGELLPLVPQPRTKMKLDPEIQSFAEEEAKKAGIDPSIVLSVIQQESGGDINAVSSKGAKGLMQLLPSTATDLGVNIDDPYDNIRGGVKYLKQQLDKYGDMKLALAAYNAGPGKVDKYKGVPPYKETQNYVASILGE